MLDISLIIPVFNDSCGIKNLIQSIDNINEISEIIIIDDGSDKIEYEKVFNYVKKYSNIYYTTNNFGKGAGGARNTGIELSTGKWLLFSDSDDEFLPSAIHHLKNYNNIDVDMVFFPPVSKDKNGQKGNRHNSYVSFFNYYWKTNDESYLRYKLPVVWSRLFNREFIERNKIAFDEILSSNDKMFSFKAGIYADKIIISNEKIYCWNYSENSLTTKVNKSKFNNMVTVSQRANQLLYKKIPKKTYNKVATSVSKLMALSVLRNNFGFSYNVKLLFFLLKNQFPLFILDDLTKIKNFFKNNKYYK